MYEILVEDFKQFKYIKDDRKISKRDIAIFFFKNLCFRLVVYMRLCKKMSINRSVFFPIFRLLYRNLSIKLGIQIPFLTDIKGGFSIHHYSCIVIHGKAKIGKNFNIRQGVTVGDVDSKVPTIGDNVFVGAGAKIIGSITIGNNVKVGANAVVSKDVPDDCTVVGFNKIIKSKLKHN